MERSKTLKELVEETYLRWLMLGLVTAVLIPEYCGLIRFQGYRLDTSTIVCVAHVIRWGFLNRKEPESRRSYLAPYTYTRITHTHGICDTCVMCIRTEYAMSPKVPLWNSYQQELATKLATIIYSCSITLVTQSKGLNDQRELSSQWWCCITYIPLREAQGIKENSLVYGDYSGATFRLRLIKAETFRSKQEGVRSTTVWLYSVMSHKDSYKELRRIH